MKKIKNILATLLAVAVILTVLAWYISFPVVTPKGNEPEWWQGQRVGGYHLHTEYSHDCSSPVPELSAAAKNHGFSFLVITDHNTMGIKESQLSNGVLLLPGVENSTKHGHLVAINPLNKPAKDGEDPVKDALEQQALVVVPHPTSLKNPWQGKFEAAHGLEIASMSSDFYNLLLPTNWGRSLLAVPALFLFPNLATSLVQHYDQEAASIVDQQLLAGHQVVPFCGIDAHDLLGYDWEITNYQLVTMSNWHEAGDLEKQSKKLFNTLKKGDFYCRSGYLGDVRLDFKANTLLNIGDHHSGSLFFKRVKDLSATVAPDPGVRIEMRLFRNGQLVSTTSGLTMNYKDPVAGAYRLEVWSELPGVFGKRMVPLFYSAPLILTEGIGGDV